MKKFKVGDHFRHQGNRYRVTDADRGHCIEHSAPYYGAVDTHKNWEVMFCETVMEKLNV